MMKKYLISLTLALALIASLPLAASAHPVPDRNREGSITVTMRYKEKAVPGGSLTLYRVGDVHEDDGNYSYVPATAFQGAVTSFEDIQSPALAETLAEYAKKQRLSPVTTKTIGNDGTVTFSGLELGLYLLVQDTAAQGYGNVSPFLVSVPYLKDDRYIYDVASTPKTGLDREVTPTKAPSYDGNLPQTGQLWWPVPVLICAGLACIAVGLFRRRRFGNESE